MIYTKYKLPLIKMYFIYLSYTICIDFIFDIRSFPYIVSLLFLTILQWGHSFQEEVHIYIIMIPKDYLLLSKDRITAFLLVGDTVECWYCVMLKN